MTSVRKVSGSAFFLFLTLCSSIFQILAETSGDSIEFFEKRIRPILAQDCYECHRTGVSEKGGLALDHREAVLKGGRSGKVIVPGDPGASLLIKALRHEDDLKMPKAGAKLESPIIADFENWVRMGAPDPRDLPANDTEISADTDWDAQIQRRGSWWSFQPIQKRPVPPASPGEKSSHPIDLFVRVKLKEIGLVPAEKADRRTLLRRLSYALRGLPPAPAGLEMIDTESSDSGYENAIDSFLASPRFGEHWARHWMDWVRYADSHGSEGDPMIPYAWRYRDYLIRALNQDVPFDQLLREHIAGDLLTAPRINHELGINESALGIGHFRMLLHGFAPTDPIEERVRNIDDQIDVLSKAFLGITVSCARCHDHKFDAISQKDFYAFYGILAATTPASIGVEAPSSETLQKREAIVSQKKEIKAALSEAWINGANNLASRLLHPDETLASAIASAKEKTSILNLLLLVQNRSTSISDVLWKWRNQQEVPLGDSITAVKRWDFQSDARIAEWRKDGTAEFRPAGSFTVAMEGDRILEAIFPSGVYSHLITTKDRAIFISPKVKLDQDYDLWLRVAGNGGAVVRYVIQNYPRDGSIYPVTRLNGGEWHWVKHSLNYWTGDRMHVELSTAADQAVLADIGATRSWFGINEVVITRKGGPQPDDGGNATEPLISALHDTEPDSIEAIAQAYARVLHDSLGAWREDRITDGQANFLNMCLQLGLMDNSVPAIPAARSLLVSYRDLENSLPEPVRAPGLIETEVEDQPLLVRGNHKQPGEIIPRRFLEVFGSAPYATQQSGRAELAEDFLQLGNPLTSRVIVNRVWHHLFGRGLVGTPDNFGRLGETPTHPELLDYLTGWFVENGYSIKKLIRFIVMSETWQASSTLPPGAQEKDPENKFLSHASVRRLEAESIRDALLAVSGNLTDEMYGPPVLGTAARRSVYVRAKRNDLDLFLSTFDTPVPSSTKGRRDVTNVPGQSLALLNDEFIFQLAERWAGLLESDSRTSDIVESIQQMFTRTLGRRATPEELEASQRLLDETARQQVLISSERQKLAENLTHKMNRIIALKAVAESRVKRHRMEAENKPSFNLPRAAAAWDFQKGLEDQVGTLHGKPMGNAHIEKGALVLDGKGSYLATPPVMIPLAAKTLEAWVQLESLDQQGGGVMTVQELGGEVFDSIVFGEKQAGHWIAGSDFFNRTSDFFGPAETETQKSAVHIAIVYALDGTISAYRNGQQYGKPYKAKSPVKFAAGNSQILLGNRHGSPTENRSLRGKIFRARLYAQALTSEEVAALARDSEGIVTEPELLAVFTPDERKEHESVVTECAEIEQQLLRIDAEKGLSSPWASLAHALFNLKEFIYVR